MTLKMIVAFDKNRSIGYQNTIPWHIPEDLQFFKSMTLGSSIIMGKNTYLSLPFRPLKGRNNVVVSSTITEQELNGAIKTCSLLSAVSIAKGLSSSECYIIGGASIYTQALSIVDEIFATEIDLTADNADTYFPDLPIEMWEKEKYKVLDTEIKSTVFKYTRKK